MGVDSRVGVQVSVMVDRGSYKCTKEYPPPKEERTKGVVTKYIQADSGRRFAIQWNFRRDFLYRKHDVVSRVYLDGQYADGMIFNAASFEDGKAYKNQLYGAVVKQDGKDYRLPFLFSDLASDDGDCSLDEARLKESGRLPGEITVRIWRIEGLHISVENTWISFKALGAIPEKALKGQAISQQACLGQPRAVGRNGHWVGYRFLDPQDKPFATFVFKYRSFAGLQALGMIRSGPLDERPVNLLSVGELRQLVRLQQQQLAAAPQTKQEPSVKREREGSADDDDSGNKLKRQSCSRRTDAEVVDLTEE